MRRSMVALACAGALLLVGCPKSRSGGGGGGGSGPTLTEVPDALVTAYCDILFRCPSTDGESSGVLLLLQNEAGCLDSLGKLLDLNRSFDDLERLVEEGTVTYDRAAASRCLGALSTSCSLPDSMFAVEDCNEVFQGTIEEGGPCSRGEECMGDSYCDHGPSGNACPGTCQPKVAAGEACNDSGTCAVGDADGVECDFAAASPVCIRVEIGAAAGVDGACGEVESAEPNVRTEIPCMAGLWCDRESSTCKAPIALDQPCSGNSSICVEGSLCLPGAGAGSTCRAIEVVRTEGGQCSREDPAPPLRFCDPFSGLVCGAGGTCELIGDGSVGAPCDSGDFGNASCNEGLICDGMTDRCATPKAANSPCSSDTECASSSCDFGAGETGSCRATYCDA